MATAPTKHPSVTAERTLLLPGGHTPRGTRRLGKLSDASLSGKSIL